MCGTAKENWELKVIVTGFVADVAANLLSPVKDLPKRLNKKLIQSEL